MAGGRRPWRVALATGSLVLAAGLPVAVMASSPVAATTVPGVQISPGAIHPQPTGKVPEARTSGPPTDEECQAEYGIDCYGPNQLQTAYDLQPLFDKGIDGSGETIVIVDAYGSPTISSDLEVFDQAYGLPAPPSLTIIQPAGTVPRYRADPLRVGWAGETNLDVEYSHAMAPGANILLVETPTNEDEGTSGFAQIETAEKYVVSHHLGGVISQSFSATEQSFPTPSALKALRGAYVEAAQKGITVLAASGDSGAADVGANGRSYFTFPVTSWPDSDPLVTGVGGTELHLASDGTKTEPDTVWNDTYDATSHIQPLAGGGGLSVIFNRPGYQDSVATVVGNARGVPDISMSGSCSGSVNVYQGFAGQVGWFPTCGTSEATPLFSGIVALADQVAGHPIGLINPALYQMLSAGAPGIVDVTSGNNTVSVHLHGHLHVVTGFPALTGYDLASGVGTVDAASFVPELAATATGGS